VTPEHHPSTRCAGAAPRRRPRWRIHRAATCVIALALSAAPLACGSSGSGPTVRSAAVAPVFAASRTPVTSAATWTPTAHTTVAATRHPVAALPLAGRVVTVDPGHDGGNFTHPQQIGRLVNDGNGQKECDTTGTAAPDGYREADFNWSVALDLQRLLRAAGARVVLTRHSNTGVGPCITERAAIGNRAHSDAAISIHADGGPPNGSGFAVLEPAPIPSRADQSIIAPSRALGSALRGALLGIGLHSSTYDGVNGIAPRTDLGGLNLSRVPKVFVEVGNMQNGPDEAPMERAAFRARVAQALLNGIERFLRERG
jgi:N-acetylmuramoyl-L-alanine amidase